MPNPFDPSYLTQASATFGPYAWGFFIFQIIVLLAGLYLAFAHNDTIPIRKQILANLGTALIIMGSLGSLLGILRLINTTGFTQRYWFYIVLLADLALAGYITYYARTTYPRQLASASNQQKRSKPAKQRQSRPTPAAAASHAPTSDQPEPATTAATRSRRDARRERKRRKK